MSGTQEASESMAAPSQEEPGNAQLTLYCLNQRWRTTLPKVHHQELRELWSAAAQEEQFRHCLASLVGNYLTQDKSAQSSRRLARAGAQRSPGI